MRKILTLCFLFFLFVHCEKKNTSPPEVSDELLEEIASSEEYRQVIIDQRNIFQAIIDKKYEMDEISREMSNKPEFDNYCQMNIEDYTAKGIEIYKELNCKKHRSKEALLDKFPIYSSLTSAQKQKISDYFTEHFRDDLPEMRFPER